MARARLDLALAAYRGRRRTWILARGLAISALCAGALSFAALKLAQALGFERDVVAGLGAALYLIVAGIAVAALAWPLRRETPRRTAAALERSWPALEGRVATYVDRAQAPGGLIDLLAEDTLGRLDAFPPPALVPSRQLALGFGAAAATALLLVGLAVSPAGSGLLRLWTLGVGAALPALRVEPGDASVQRGVELTVRARAEAFEPREVEIAVEFEGADAPEVAALQPDGSGGFTLRFAAVDRPFTYTVQAGRISSGPHRVRVLDPPRIVGQRLRYVYPEWAHLEPRVVEPGEDIAALEGTRVELELTTDAPLEAGAVVVDGAERALEVEGNLARGVLTVEKRGSYHVAARFQGEPVRLTRDFSIELLADQAPTLEIAKPGRDRSASAIEEVTVRVRARDDIHLERLDLLYSVNGGAWRTQRLSAQGAASDVDHVFALETLEEKGLAPGDVIAYYARVRDRAQSAQTDLYFVEVRPFERSYTQSQQAGGGGGGGPGDISARQRQILVATWNLVHAPEGRPARDPADVAERAALLERLQQTLLAQTRALVDRLGARGLAGSDEAATGFVADLTSAATFMEEAARRLEARDLSDAIEPEQRALQGLLRAEASLRELQFSMQADGEGGGGASDLEELIGLEMDPSKNQYEVGARESRQTRDPEEEAAFRKLEELARRQQALAEELARTPQPTLAQRWRQETLRRELEELQRSLASQPGTPGDLSRQIETAVNELSTSASASDPGAPSRANAARESLERALESAREQRRERLDRDVAELSRRARELAEAQQQTSERLQSAIERGLGGMDGDEDFREPSDEENDLAREHTELQREVENLQRDSAALAERLRESAPDLATRLGQARQELDAADVTDSLARSGDLIRRGVGSFAGGSDEEIARALREFSDAAHAVEGRLRSAPGGIARSDPEATQRRLAELRRALERAGERAPRPAAGRERWSPPSSWTELDRSAAQAVSDALNEASRSAPALAGDIERAGGPPRALRALGGGSRPSDLDLAQRRSEAIAELDQLELDLRAVREARKVVASQSAESLPSDIEDPDVSRYFRRLSEEGGEAPRR
jgi:hypothetical protein